MNPPLRRPAGVTAAAVVALLGSLVTFLVAVMIFTTAFIELPPPRPPNYPALAIGMGLFIAAMAIVGVATSIALLKMRRWARTSVLVFSVVLVIACAFGLLAALVMPMPPVPNGDPKLVRVIQVVTTGVFAIPLLVGAWWLVQFNLRSVKDAFAAAAGASDVDFGLPLSISITAWVSIVGGVACLIPIVTRMPAFLFGVTIEGWVAGVVYAFFGAISIYMGRGLLDLQERARLLCIGWYLFFALHMAVVTAVPSFRAKMLAMQRALQQGAEPAAMDPLRLTYVTLALGALIAVLAIGFLHKHRALFKRHPDAG